MKERAAVLDTLQKINYPNSFIQRVEKRSMRKSIQRPHKLWVTTSTLAYRVGISEDLRGILNSFDIRVLFETCNSPGSILVKSKNPISTEKQRNSV